MREKKDLLARLAIFAAAMVGLLALPGMAHGTHITPPEGVMEIEQFTFDPLNPAAGPIGWGQPLSENGLLTAAGGHPNMRIHMRFCNPETDPTNPTSDDSNHGCTETLVGSQVSRQLKDFKIGLPPGMLGNPTALGTCFTFEWIVGSCPLGSQLGASFTNTLTRTTTEVPTPLYNVDTLGLEPARLGTKRLSSTPPTALPIYVSLRTESDYGIDSAVINIPKALGTAEARPVIFVDTVLCARVPCQETDNQNPTTVRPIDPATGNPVDPATAKPFFVNPTSCDKPAAGRLEVRSWRDPAYDQSKSTSQDFGVGGPDHPSFASFSKTAFTPTDCEGVPFTPQVSATPTGNTKAGAPSGYRVSIQYPDYANDDRWQAALKNANVTLPEGVTLAAGGGAGLESCSASQFGVDLGPPVRQNNHPVDCPEASHVGDLRIDTPVLDNPLFGKAFFGPTSGPGRPTPERPWKLFLLIEGAGLRIKLVGDVSLCAGPDNPVPECDADGQIRTVFVNQPEVPFTTFQLDLRGGPNAILQNPRTCGPHTSQVTLQGYNGKDSVSNPTVTPTENCDAPFQPAVEEARADPEQAGAHSVSRLVISRPDGHQLIKRLQLSLPPGAAGSLAASPQCPASVVRRLASDPSANCSESSKVGVIRNTVGTDEGSLTVSGSIYIGEPIESGDAASFVIVVPAQVGPIDLGRVVVVNRVKLRPSDTGVDVFSSDIPTILEGIPLPVKRIEVVVNRDNFFFNPTGCDSRTFTATFTSDLGATASSSVPAAAKGCQVLGFSPRLRLIAGARGATRNQQNVPLKAIVTQQHNEANIAKARVIVPDIIRPDVPQIQTPGVLCNDAQLAARRCPPLSQIGTAHVITPVLPFSLSGPVHIVLRAGSPLPNLVIFLRGGGFEVVLTATNGFSGIRILNEFPSVPDVPQARFELNVKGGKDGILLSYGNLCRARPPLPRIDATFTGHNGKVFRQQPRLQAAGCVRAASAGLTIASRRVKVSRKGVAPVKLRCAPAGGRCRGRLLLRGTGKRKMALGGKSFSVRAGKSKTVKVKLRKKGRRAVFRAKQMRVRVTAVVRGAKDRRKLVRFSAQRRKR